MEKQVLPDVPVGQATLLVTVRLDTDRTLLTPVVDHPLFVGANAKNPPAPLFATNVPAPVVVLSV